MVKIICEKTGIEFEAATKRTKSHPQIMGAINEAYKEQWYSQALEAIKVGREQGLTDVKDFLALLEETRQAALKQQSIDYRAAVDRKQAEREAHRQRAITNQTLREHGYTWHVWKNDEEDIDLLGYPEKEFFLTAPDGRHVSVAQALKEIGD